MRADSLSWQTWLESWHEELRAVTNSSGLVFLLYGLRQRAMTNLAAVWGSKEKRAAAAGRRPERKATTTSGRVSRAGSHW